MRRKRNRFKARLDLPKAAKVPTVSAGVTEVEPEITAIAAWFRKKDPTGEVTAEVIRDSFDLALDGQRTGRWCYGQLTKTEKTHLGTILQLELQKEYDISDDGPLDYAVAGIPVDCKYSAEFGKWQIPREMYRPTENPTDEDVNHIALLVWAEEASRAWWTGLIRITDDRLSPGRNRDMKRTLRPEALADVHWIWPQPPLLPKNTLLELSDEDRIAIFSHRSGQKRINELLRRVQLTTIRRSVIETVAQQEDPLKRPRDAREQLRPDGILVFGHEKAHRQVAHALGIDRLPTVDYLPDKGEFLTARVVPADPGTERPVAVIEGRSWVLAEPTEPHSKGPKLPPSGAKNITGQASSAATLTDDPPEGEGR